MATVSADAYHLAHRLVWEDAFGVRTLRLYSRSLGVSIADVRRALLDKAMTHRREWPGYSNAHYLTAFRLIRKAR